MALKLAKSSLFLTILLLSLVVLEAAVEPTEIIRPVRRSSFPKGFVFGSSSSGYQYEGAFDKGHSIWDTYTHQHPERILDHSNGSIAADQYHRYKEDVGIMKNIGFDAYRFSISWPRILPSGRRREGVHRAGIEYYNNLINELLSKGIQPYATLFHWEVPQTLEDKYQGFLNDTIINDFRDFAELCFEEFGDRVKHWITFNEQYVFALGGYAKGSFAPGRCSPWQPFFCSGGDSGTEPYIVAHNQILAHAAAVHLYKSKYQAHQKGEIGVSLVSTWYVPYSDSAADKDATKRALDFSLGWFIDPLVYGDYPPTMRGLVKERLPTFTPDQKNMILNSYDFIGINYYTSNYVQNNDNADPTRPSLLTDVRANTSTDRNGISIGPKVNGSTIADYPKGLKEMLNYINITYKSPAIYITENGILDFDTPDVSKLIEDKSRIVYYARHLDALQGSVKAGVRVKGHFAWSFLDCFEWFNGYTQRFGLVYIDYHHTRMRLPKQSAKWFNHFLST